MPSGKSSSVSAASSSAVPSSSAGSASDGAGPRRLLRLIDVLAYAGEPMRLADLATAAALSKPTAHRLLGVLAAEGWVIAHHGGRYGIGPALRGMGAALTSTGRQDSVERVIVDLQHQVRQTVHVGMRSGDRVIYTHKVEGDQPFAMASRVGMQQALHSTAIGKCILADLDGAALAEFVARTGLAGRTPQTRTTLPALTEELDRVRSDGYALDDQENEPNVRCIAAPIHGADGRVMGAVSISTVTFVVGHEEVLALHPPLAAAAKRLEALFMG